MADSIREYLSILGKRSTKKRFAGKTKKEISEYMKAIRNGKSPKDLTNRL